VSQLPAALPEEVRALAEADFSAVASRFTAAGFAVTQPADGILTIKAAGDRPSVLISVGVHGDETDRSRWSRTCWTPCRTRRPRWRST
jgi:succinylglutamate desuccinylase